MKYLVFIFAAAFLSCSDKRQNSDSAPPLSRSIKNETSHQKAPNQEINLNLFQSSLSNVGYDVGNQEINLNLFQSSLSNVRYGVGLEESAINFDTTYGDFKDHFLYHDRSLTQELIDNNHYKNIPTPVQRRPGWPKPHEVDQDPIITYHPEAGMNLYWTVGDKSHEDNENKNILSLIVLYPPFEGSINLHINSAIHYINLSQYTESGLPYIKLNESIKIEEDQSFEMFSMHAYGMFEKNYSIENTNFWLGVHPNRSPIHCLREDRFITEYKRRVEDIEYKGENCKLFTHEEMTIIYLPNLIFYFSDKKLFQVDVLRPINYNTAENIQESQTEIYRALYEDYENENRQRRLYKEDFMRTL